MAKKAETAAGRSRPVVNGFPTKRTKNARTVYGKLN